MAADGWWVYVVRCADATLYTGVTRDLERRISEHNGGRGARYTRPRRPVQLIYSEPAENRSEAQRREHVIRQWPAARKRELEVLPP